MSWPVVWPAKWLFQAWAKVLSCKFLIPCWMQKDWSVSTSVFAHRCLLITKGPKEIPTNRLKRWKKLTGIFAGTCGQIISPVVELIHSQALEGVLAEACPWQPLEHTQPDIRYYDVESQKDQADWDVKGCNSESCVLQVRQIVAMTMTGCRWRAMCWPS